MKPHNIKKILLIFLLFLIIFVLIPLLIYSTGTMDSTNYYYRMESITSTITLLNLI